MRKTEILFESLDAPQDYFKGFGFEDALPTPRNILLFLRRSKDQLQQNALQNRSHHRFVLVFNLETAGQVHVDHHQILLQPGQALLIFPFQFHHFSQLQSQKLKWLICTFELEKSSFLKPLQNQSITVSENGLAMRDQLFAAWKLCSSGNISTSFQDMQLQASSLKLLVNLMEGGELRTPDIVSEAEDNLIRNVNRLLTEWQGRQVIVQNLADELRMSESRFRFLFKEVSGISIGSYLQNFRINRAMSLLRTKDLPIAEVAIEAGFGSPQAFCRIFKQKTGLSPRAYRCSH